MFAYVHLVIVVAISLSPPGTEPTQRDAGPLPEDVFVPVADCFLLLSVGAIPC
jgi:hypothetical protein